MNSQLDQAVRMCLSGRSRSLIRMLSILKKDMDWKLTERLQQRGYQDFKMGDMVLIANILPEGTINNELAKKARITKQAMSKVVKNLEASGYILTRKHETDNRATVIFLSDKGKELFVAATECIQEIQSTYTAVIGEADTETLKNILTKLLVEIYPEFNNV